MCKITIVNYKNLSKNELLRILLLNATSGNEDGFGYYTFDNSYFRTEKSFADVYQNAYENFPKDLRGIYHVRKSSTFNNYIPIEKDSHPFIVNNLVVAHNGSLNFRHTHKNAKKYDKLFNHGDIDSLQYTKVLESITRDGELSYSAIKEAINLFSGAFLLVHFDKRQPDNIYISRGKDRILYVSTHKNNDGEVIGTLFNTSYQELYQFNCVESLTRGVNSEIVPLKENTTYLYNRKTFLLTELGKIEQDSFYEGSFAPNHNTSPTIVIPASKIETPYEEFIQHCNRMEVELRVTPQIFKYLFDKSIINATEAELNKFVLFLSKVYRESFSIEKEALWLRYTNTLYEFGIDDYYGEIQYPYVINSNKVLKRVYNRLSYGIKGAKNELPAD
jgi:predicted glutamine amidotransferase